MQNNTSGHFFVSWFVVVLNALTVIEYPSNSPQLRANQTQSFHFTWRGGGAQDQLDKNSVHKQPFTSYNSILAQSVAKTFINTIANRVAPQNQWIIIISQIHLKLLWNRDKWHTCGTNEWIWLVQGVGGWYESVNVWQASYWTCALSMACDHLGGTNFDAVT